MLAESSRLIPRELLEQKPGVRVLYLAPARLVSNVRREFDRLNLPFRSWTASEADARLTDPRILASPTTLTDIARLAGRC